MPLKPWKPLLLTALTVGAGATAATAQNVASAQKAIELERYNEARGLLRGASSPEANFELGRLYQMREIPDSAAYYFNRAGGATPAGMVAEGRALLAKGKNAEAEAKFEAAAKATKNKDTKVLTMIAQAYGESDVKDITKPLTYVKTAEALSKGKDDPTLMVARGDIYLLTDQGGGEAMSSFDRATAANPQDAGAFYKKGVLNVRSRNGADAKSNLDKAIAINPQYAPAYKELAEMYFSSGQYEKAVSTFEQYKGMAEKSSTTDAEYASFLYLSKKYPESLVEVNKVLAVEPNNFTMNRLKAFNLYETGDYPGSLAAMDQFLKIAPADKVLSEDNAYRSKILLKMGKGGDAVDILQKSVATTTDPAKKNEVMHDLYTAYNSQKDYPNAIKTLKQIVATPYGDLADQFRLGSAYSSTKQYAQADSVYNIIITAKPTYVPAYLARAEANFGLDPESTKGTAKPFYEKYLELASADPTKYRGGIIESNNYLGYYNLKKGDKAAATPYYQKVLELDPTNADATNAMKIIKGVPRTTTVKKTTTAKKK
ncbi:tetratricopeptide repeat protein [Hymenobacter sp. H14-R3]|uniref:tetratricopeptide repeat protein n=1 Tax=Hymenobacter sp. H14-R3 TaxID=3046308 RepID=UPI0024B93901|nr:tetratricopeptide repeat protein [Hymenobacter sp. H14-R3]MDJ0363867.1 tetratricopeptide repeat protein [Hymenobacter sp. H14-R3]